MVRNIPAVPAVISLHETLHTTYETRTRPIEVATRDDAVTAMPLLGWTVVVSVSGSGVVDCCVEDCGVDEGVVDASVDDDASSPLLQDKSEKAKTTRKMRMRRMVTVSRCLSEEINRRFWGSLFMHPDHTHSGRTSWERKNRNLVV